MPDLPVMLKVCGKRCVVIGGGGVALRRAGTLAEAGAAVTLIAPQVQAATDAGPAPAIEVVQRTYRSGDVAGAFLVVVATDDPTVNEQVTREARAAGALVNRADDPTAGDIVIPAHAHHGPVTLAVHTGGIAPAAAATIRRQLSEALDPDWPALLETVAPYRARIQAAEADEAQRQKKLRALTDTDALAAMRRGGREALLAYCERLIGNTSDG